MSKTIQYLFSKNQTDLVLGIVSCLVAIWVIFFAIPALFANLFNNILGNLILVGIVILTGMYNPIVAICLAVIFIILVRMFHMYSF
jgi:hypothetical protein